MDRNELAKVLEWDADTLVNMSGLREQDSRVQSLRAAAEIIRQSAWRPMSEAPKDGTPVDLWRGKWNERVVNMRRVELAPDNVFYEPVESGPSCVRDATAWRPIPPPPEDAIDASRGAED